MKAVLALSLLMCFAAIATLASPASAANTRYFVGADAGCSAASQVWSNTACWSASSQGPTGASVPVAGDAVIMDAGADQGANILNTAEAFATLDATPTVGQNFNLRFFGTGSLAAGTITSHMSNPNLFFIDGSGPGVGTLTFSGSIDGSTTGADIFIGVNAPLEAFSYVGSNVFGTMSYVDVAGTSATGKVIYCYPGCVDSGGNSGILFIAPPTPGPASACQTITQSSGFPFGAIVLVVLGVGLMFVALTLIQKVREKDAEDVGKWTAALVTLTVIVLITTALVAALGC